MERIENELVEQGRAFEKESYQNVQCDLNSKAGSSCANSEKALTVRSSNHDISPIFLKRWSPRALAPVALEQEHLNRLFEAARWAPSTYNEQEWRFLYAFTNTPDWDLFFEALTEQNRSWCANAGALLCICGKNELSRTGKVNTVRSFDCGAAFQNMALQAAEMGVVVHGMAGFSPEIIRKNLEVPIEFSIEAMAAIGYPGDPALLDPALREKEAPSLRRPLTEIVARGKFTFSE